MSRTRLYQIGGIGVAILVLVASWFLLISPMRQDADALRAQASDLQSQTLAKTAKISLLKKQSKELPAQQAMLADVSRRLPADPALPSLIRSMTDLARGAHVSLLGLTPGAPTPVAAQASAPAPAPSNSTDPGAAVAPAAAAKVPMDDASGLHSVPVQLNVCGQFSGVRAFLNRLETLKRAMLVTGFTLTRGECGSGAGGDASTVNSLNMAVTGQVFTLPTADAALTAALPAAAKAKKQ